MNTAAPQKIKLLLLMEKLWQDSDEQNPLTTRQLIRSLEERGISCDRRTLSRDIGDLNQAGYEVMSVMCGHEKGYYVDDRKFSVPELRILMDAVQAAGFIPPQKSHQLMEKIAALGGSYRANLLQSNTVLFNTSKHSNDFVYYTIDTLEQALSGRRKVSFRYYKLNENCQRVFQREGARYLVEPVSLILDRANYYLAALCDEREGLSIYRIDRIADMELEDAPVSREALEARHNIPRLSSQTVKMFQGPMESVTLEFEDCLTGPIYDQFGEDIRICRISGTRCRAQFNVQISNTFFGWLLQFGSDMELISPANVVRELHDFVRSLPY